MLRRLLSAALVAAAALGAVPGEAHAWNRAGHMVSGSIAYRRLQREDARALARAVAILERHPEAGTRWKPHLEGLRGEQRAEMMFMLAARWPDDVRDARQYDHPTWHYVNMPFVPEGDTTKAPELVSGEALTELAHNLSALRDPQAADSARAVALAWVLHIAGDLHQPLHAVNLYSVEHPRGDRGGNGIYVRARAGAGAVDLHKFWDDLIIGSENPRSVLNRSSELRATHPASGFPADALRQLDPARWARDESLPLARRLAYLDGALRSASSREKAATLPDDYRRNAQAAAQQRVTLAGYRMAALLSGSLGAR